MIPFLQKANYSKRGDRLWSSICLWSRTSPSSERTLYFKWCIASGIQRSLSDFWFNFCILQVFGMFATYLVLRTGTVWSAVVAHSLCNAYGFPDLSVFFPSYDGGRWSKTRVTIIGIYIAGLVGFFWLLEPLTSF
ncbi:hypothetical protein BDR26DRAFT_863686 [Obelidium mucronatum]|nr:hypothetical protein BDR26DRAFT_863686 [Obelidium mucronatum]